MQLFRHAKTFEEHPAGTILVREGEPGRHMYVIQEGEIEVTRDGAVLERLGPGGMYGEMVLVDDLPRSATARATSAVRIVPIDEAEFTRLVERTPGFALEVMREMARRLRSMHHDSPPSS